MTGMTDKPVFVAVEGADGSGKTTVGKLLAENLDAVLLETPDAELRDIRKKIDDFYAESPLAAQLFYASTVAYASARAKEFLEQGQSVVVIRYWASTEAYNGIVRESEMDDSAWIDEVLAPHFTCYVEAPDDIRGEWMEKRGKKNLTDERSLRLGKDLEARYRHVLAKRETRAGRVLRVSNDATPEDCADRILREMREHSGRV